MNRGLIIMAIAYAAGFGHAYLYHNGYGLWRFAIPAVVGAVCALITDIPTVGKDGVR